MRVLRTRYPREHKTYEAVEPSFQGNQKTYEPQVLRSGVHKTRRAEAPESLLGLATEGLNRVIQDVVRSSEISIWKAAGGVEEQMYSPQCLKNPFEKG